MKPLNPEALSTTHESGGRINLYPTQPPKNGFWLKRKKVFHWIVLAIYLAIPWIKIQGHPLLLLDVEHRRFSIFGTLFFAHEVPNLIFVIISFLMVIALTTTILGRVWCGWSCPQTLFVERIYRSIENWIEGEGLTRKRRDLGPASIDRTFRKTAKWLAFIVVSGAISHSFLAYFVGAENIAHFASQSPTHHPKLFVMMLVMTGIVLFDFGWFREQFCLIACPYGRFQSVMMDEHSLFIGYQNQRPDCIECGKCVTVCPTGIDIRNGLQFECIACTACADACDSVMEKIGKPKKLIGYFSLRTLAGKTNSLLRGRVFVYASILVVSMGILTFRLSRKEPLQTEITRAVNTPYQLVKNGDGENSVINHFKANFYNLSWESDIANLTLSEESIALGMELIKVGTQDLTAPVASGEKSELQFFIKSPWNESTQHQQPMFQTEWKNSHFLNRTPVKLVGPTL